VAVKSTCAFCSTALVELSYSLCWTHSTCAAVWVCAASLEYKHTVFCRYCTACGVCGAGCVCASAACLWMHRTMVCMHPFRLELASNVSTARHNLACAYHLSLRLVVAGAVNVLEIFFCLPCCTVHALFGAAALSCLPCSGSTMGVWVARRSSLCDSVHATTKKFG
jgi:hypothetical protein